MKWRMWVPKTEGRVIEAECPGDALRVFLGAHKQFGGGWVQLVDCIPATVHHAMIMRVRYRYFNHVGKSEVSPIVYMRQLD